MKINRFFLVLFISVAAFFFFSFLPYKKNVQAVKVKWLDSVLSIKNDTTYVINFWATWCIPCVAELPAFEKAHQKYSGRKVRIILVSLDYIKKMKEQLIPFLERKRILSNVVLLNEPDGNTWIDKVDDRWSGAMPATLIVNKHTSFRSFLEKDINFETLDSLIKISLKQ